MNRHRANHVVNLDDLQQLDTAGTDRAADNADYHGPEVGHDVGSGRYGNQTGQAAVEANQQVYATKHQPGQSDGGDHAGRCGQIGVHEDVAHTHRVACRAQGQLGTAVETEPAEPQDEYAQGDQYHVGRRSGSNLPVGTEFAESWADHQRAGQGSPAAGAVDDGGAGEVLETHLSEPSAAPGPRADDGIQQCGEDQGEQEETPHLHALGQRAGDDGSGGGDEDHLEEPVGHHRVAVAQDAFQSGIISADQGDLVGGWAVQRPNHGADDRLDVVVHQVVPDEVEGQTGDGVEADVLQADHGSVFGSDRTSLQHGETGAHPHYQRAPDEKGECVEYELGFVTDAGSVGGVRPGDEG